MRQFLRHQDQLHIMEGNLQQLAACRKGASHRHNWAELIYISQPVEVHFDDLQIVYRPLLPVIPSYVLLTRQPKVVDDFIYTVKDFFASAWTGSSYFAAQKSSRH